MVIPTFDRSGAEKQFALLAAGLPREGFDVHAIALTRSGPLEKELHQAGVPVTLIGKRWRADPLAWWKLRGLFRQLQPQIIHTWLFAANSYGRLALSRDTEAKMVVSERCVDLWKGGLHRWLDRRLAARTDCLVANSKAVADFYRMLGYAEEQLHVIPNAIPEPARPDPSRKQFCASLKLPDDAKLVFSVGRLAPQKRVHDLIWAIQLLRQADPKSYLIVIGAGPERDRLLRLSYQYESRRHIRFLGHREDAASLLHYADAFWLASEYEGQSNSLMEALACACPAIVTDIPPNREQIVHGQNGYLVDVGDGVAFAQYTQKIWNDPLLAKTLRESGQRKMIQEFPVDKMVGAYADLYRRLLTSEDVSRMTSQPKF